jgi:acetyl-CoA carboxylase, biotin carboxylase subunit
MFKKILVANRGEISLRVIRACKELGIPTVAIYSDVDNLSLHTKFADEAICVGPGDPRKSYLNIPAIIAAAELTNADAIHPGYGFLSENAEFSDICNENNLSFIGPSAHIINTMGNKSVAKETMENFGIPVIPGSKGNINTLDEGLSVANEIGYPVIIKAASGGGGRGMRIVNNPSEFELAFSTAQAEAKISFNDSNVYLEKYFINPKHIEIQIIADSKGNVYSLLDRECSVQRRHQKIIEEAPSPVISSEIRKRMSDISIKAAKDVKYIGVGTIEYIYDVEQDDFYFMEMNTRVQVEHPVTEMILNYDIVKNQILCHAGLTLPNWLDDMKPRGHAIECRINAEDPSNNFMPSPGLVTSLHFPGGNGVRVDTHIYAGYTVPANYDSMISKIIVHSPSRNESIKKMCCVLDECVIEGIKTTIPFQKQVLRSEEFLNGTYTTNFLNTFEYKGDDND